MLLYAIVAWVAFVACVIAAGAMCGLCFKARTGSPRDGASAETALLRPPLSSSLSGPGELPSPAGPRRGSAAGDKAITPELRERVVSLVVSGSSSWAVLDAICESAGPAESESIALSLLYVLGPRTPDAVAHAVAREAELSHGQLDMLRGNTCGVRSFVFLARFGGQAYLSQVVGPILRRIRDSSGPFGLLADTSAVLDALAGQKAVLDPAIAGAIASGAAAAVTRFGEPARMQAASTLFFLRFVCPAIVSPELYGLFPRMADPAASSHLRLVARVLQCIANGTEFPRGQPGFESSSAQATLDAFIRDHHAAAMAAIDAAITRSTKVSAPASTATTAAAVAAAAATTTTAAAAAAAAATTTAATASSSSETSILPVTPQLREEATTILAAYFVQKAVQLHSMVAERDALLASAITEAVTSK